MVWVHPWDDLIPFSRVPSRAPQNRLLHERYRFAERTVPQAAVRRGHFPTEQAATKVLYLVSIERRKNRSNPTGRIHGWKPS